MILQEDPGGQPYLARIRSYLPDNGKLTGLFRFDPALFDDLTLPPTPPFTIDEEGSGVIEITRIVKTAPWFTPTRRYYLGTAQTHAALVDHDGGPEHLTTTGHRARRRRAAYISRGRATALAPRPPRIKLAQASARTPIDDCR